MTISRCVVSLLSVVRMIFVICVIAANPMTPASATQVRLEIGDRIGQGYLLSVGTSLCMVITAAHVLEGTAADEIITVIGPSGYARRALRGTDIRFTKLGDQIAGIVVPSAEEEGCDPGARAGAGEESLPIQGPVLAYREHSGALIYLKTEVPGRAGSGEMLVRAEQNEHCLIESGRSGSIVLSENLRILGMLTSSPSNTVCIGKVLPIEVINTYMMDAFDIQFPLHEYSIQFLKAARDADDATLYSLLDKGADPNTTGLSNQVALERLASTYSNFPVGELDKVPASVPLDERMQVACRDWTARRLQMIQELLNRGARADGAGGGRWTPLMSAVSSRPDDCDNSSIVERLLKAGANPNAIYRYKLEKSYFDRPLTLAIENGTSRAVELLLQWKADANLPDNRGSVPIQTLAVTDKPDVDNEKPFSDYCWNSDNVVVRKFRYLLQYSDLTKTIPENATDYELRDFRGMTVDQILRKQLHGGCKTPRCDGTGQTGPDRCYERMLRALSNSH